MLPSETMIWQPEFTDKTLSRKPGAVQILLSLSLSFSVGAVTGSLLPGVTTFHMVIPV
ncbi:transposase [Shigella sp. FC1764]|nr:transposase [Shigella sp. FC1764]